MKKPFRFIALPLLTAVAALLNPAAHGAIDNAPASIIDNGTYITDSANNLDWYKFDNSVTTIGMSYQQILDSSAFATWAPASLAQVQSLETHFGWAFDTPSTNGLNENFGLTDAMAGYLGYTSSFFALGTPDTERTDVIEVMTSESYFFFGSPDIYQLVTTSRTFMVTDLHNQSFFYGDYVEGGYRLQNVLTEDDSAGTWLVRTHQRDDGGPGRNVPGNSETLLLSCIGFAALAGFSRSNFGARRS